MHSVRRIGFHSFLAVSIALLVGAGSDLSAQGRGRGGDRGGGGQAQRQAPQAQRPQRQQPQMRQQAQRPERRQMPQMQRPQFERRQMQAQRPQRPQFERRQMPQMQRQQRQQRPQFERRQTQAQRPQVERRQMPQMQRQRPQFERRQAPQMDRRAGRERPQMQRQDRGRQARIERVRPQRQEVIRSQPRSRDRNQSALQDRRAGIQRPDRGRDRTREGRATLPGITQGRETAGLRERRSGNDRAFRNDRGGFGNAGLVDDRNIRRDRSGRTRGEDGGALLARGFQRGEADRDRGRWRDRFEGRDIDFNRAGFEPFRERARELRQQALNEGWNFDDRHYRRNVWEYTQREAWRDDVLRSAISVNFGFRDDYYYIPPPAYATYTSVAYDPWYYNIGTTYYDPVFSSFWVAPVSWAYRPYDYYYSSYNYYDPYYFDDPYDDFVTVRLFASSGGGFISRLFGGLLAYGYDQGYRDGLLAREAGYVDYSYYEDPYVYYEDPYYEDDYYYDDSVETSYAYYEPYNSYSVYENRRCLSEGYELGYRDALYGTGEYDPYEAAANVDLVSIYVGATWQLV